jgi:PAS domain S-box-containing protein
MDEKVSLMANNSKNPAKIQQAQLNPKPRSEEYVRKKNPKGAAVISKSEDEALEWAESIIDTIREPLIALDQDLRVVNASRSFYEFFEVNPEETVGQLIYDLGNKQWDIPKLRELLETILPQKATFDNYEVEHYFATIGRRVMLLNARQIHRVLGKERIILLAIEDITERRDNERALQALEEKYHLLSEQTLAVSEETFRLAIERLIVGITVTDLKGTIRQANNAFVHLHGFQNKKEIMGHNTLDFIDKTDHARAIENLDRTIVEGHSRDVEFTVLRTDGSKFAAELSAAAIEDSHGLPQGIVVTTRDITERKRLDKEREKFIEELKEKNAELERFTYTVSHDLKSPLVTVKTFLGYLKYDIAVADALLIEKDMFYMNSAADKMADLLEELLEMSRVGQIANLPVTVTFDELMEETLSITAGRIAEKGVQIRLHQEPVSLFGDRTRLVEIWQNLVENAVKFMGDRPSPQIDIGVERNGNGPVFFVRDNGIGIEPKYQTKLFNIFEKLNPKMEGTGMGLAITKRIVELYQGKIWVESKGLGQGTTFFFTLPGALKDKAKGALT